MASILLTGLTETRPWLARWGFASPHIHLDQTRSESRWKALASHPRLVRGNGDISEPKRVSTCERLRLGFSRVNYETKAAVILHSVSFKAGVFHCRETCSCQVGFRTGRTSIRSLSLSFKAIQQQPIIQQASYTTTHSNISTPNKLFNFPLHPSHYHQYAILKPPHPPHTHPHRLRSRNPTHLPLLQQHPIPHVLQYHHQASQQQW